MSKSLFLKGVTKRGRLGKTERFRENHWKEVWRNLRKGAISDAAMSA